MCVAQWEGIAIDPESDHNESIPGSSTLINNPFEKPLQSLIETNIFVDFIERSTNTESDMYEDECIQSRLLNAIIDSVKAESDDVSEMA